MVGWRRVAMTEQRTAVDYSKTKYTKLGANSMIVCIAEDRISEESAVRFLLLSLTKHCPDIPIVLYFPPATDNFKGWLDRLQQVTLRCPPFPKSIGWNVKSYALLALLEEGQEEVWWIDSDIILTCDFRRSVGKLADATLVVTEDALSGFYRNDGYRARAWGFEVGRLLPFCLNTGVLRVTQQHIPLLQRWQQLTEDKTYLKTQTLPYNRKPFHMFGDQDAFTALLDSREFSDVHLKILHRGKDIIQYFGPAGYTLQERFLNLMQGLPPFIHSQGEKPWYRQKTPPKWIDFFQYLSYVRLEVSPYNRAASPYKHQVEKDVDWLICSSRLGKLLFVVGFGNAALTGMPLAVLYSLWHFSKQLREINNRFDPKQAYEEYIAEKTKSVEMKKEV